MGTASLRDPVTDFINRNAEKRYVQSFCEKGPGAGNRCLILRATRDVGVTFFLRHLEQTLPGGWFAVYTDCGSSDPEVIFRKFFDRLEDRKVLRWRALSGFRELGEAAVRAVAALLLPAPVAALGPLAGAMAPKLATTAYASTPSERFSKLIRSGRWNRPVLFLVDNAQEIKPQSLNILSTVFSPQYDHVRFVLSFVGNGEKRAFEDFDRRLQAFGLGVETLEFKAPDDRFVTQIAERLEVRLSPGQRDELVRAGSGSLSRILTLLRPGHPSGRPSLVEQEILRYLIVAGQPLRRDDVLALVLRSPRLASPEGEVQSAVDGLARRRLVLVHSHWLGDEVEVAPGQERYVREAVPGFADLVAAQELYAHFATVQEVRSPRHSESAYGALLYQLAKQVDPASVSRRAFDLVRISLAQADLSAAGYYVERAIGGRSARAPADLYTLLAFRVSVQDYTGALKTLDELGPGYWRAVRALRIIHAIALNRVRAHGASDREIDTLLAEPETTAEEFALLTSYKVAGLLHEGQTRAARDVFECSLSRIRPARNSGYALRNCAAVYFWGEGRDAGRAAAVLAEATKVFQARQDAFGVYTTLANRGALVGSSAERRRGAAEALPMFQRSFNALAVFGTQHLEEVGSNLGTALLLTGQASSAATHLRKMVAIASDDFPKVMMESALAFTEVIAGNANDALARVRRLTKWVDGVKLPEATYRANVNAAAVEAAVRASDERFDGYLAAARAAGFWAGSTSLDRVASGARDGAISPDSLPDYLSFDYFQYWSQNPLSFIAPPLLPEKAVRHDVPQ